LMSGRLGGHASGRSHLGPTTNMLRRVQRHVFAPIINAIFDEGRVKASRSVG
jgi:hypothetical protein